MYFNYRRSLKSVTEKKLFLSEVEEFANSVFCGNRRNVIIFVK